MGINMNLVRLLAYKHIKILIISQANINHISFELIYKLYLDELLLLAKQQILLIP